MYQCFYQKWMFKHFHQSIESIVMPSRYLKVMKANSWYLCRAQTYSVILISCFVMTLHPELSLLVFYDHPRNMIFAYCCMLSIKTLNLFTGHLLQGSLAAPSLDLFGRFEWPTFRASFCTCRTKPFFVQHNYPELTSTSTKCLKTVSTFTAITSQKYDKCTKEESNCIEKTSNLDQSGILWHCQQPYHTVLAWAQRALAATGVQSCCFLARSFKIHRRFAFLTMKYQVNTILPAVR